MSGISTKPYLLRAWYEWCVDSGYTPNIVAWVNEHTQVPMQYVRDNEIALNIGPQAAQGLLIDNEWVHFAARFAGVSHDIWIPVGHVSSIFARETGVGMGFEVEAQEVGDASEEDGAHLNLLATPKTDVAQDDTILSSKPVGSKKGLKIIK